MMLIFICLLFDDERITYNVDVRKNFLLLWSTRQESIFLNRRGSLVKASFFPAAYEGINSFSEKIPRPQPDFLENCGTWCILTYSFGNNQDENLISVLESQKSSFQSKRPRFDQSSHEQLFKATECQDILERIDLNVLTFPNCSR